MVTALPATVAVMLYRRPPLQKTSTLSLVTMPWPVESVATPVSLSVRVVRLPALPASTAGDHWPAPSAERDSCTLICAPRT